MNPKMKILIAWDGSECADDALDDLPRAGLPRKAEAVMISVAEFFLPPPMPSPFGVAPGATEPFAAALRETHAQVLAASLRLRESFPAWDICTETMAGSPASVVLAKGEEWQPDLIVAGSHERSKRGRFILGSVSQRIVTDAHCSVRIGRWRIENATEPVRLVIGIDGSPEAEAAVQAVAEREWPDGSEVRVIAARDNPIRLLIGVDGSAGAEAAAQSVLQRQWAKSSQARVVNAALKLPPGTVPELNVERVADWMSSENARVREAIESAENRLRAIGLETTTVFKEEDPKKLLVSEAESWGADCIFVGAKGTGRIERFVIGSVSATVAARAHCSVEVVRTTT